MSYENVKDLLTELGEMVAEPKRSDPCKALWAMNLLHGARGALRGDRQDHYWLFLDNRTYIGSLSWICDILQIELSHIRKVVERISKSNGNASKYCHLKSIL